MVLGLCEGNCSVVKAFGAEVGSGASRSWLVGCQIVLVFWRALTVWQDRWSFAGRAPDSSCLTSMAPKRR